MKKWVFLFAAWILFSSQLSAQVKNYNVVFDMTSRDTINQQSLIRLLNAISQSSPEAKLEVVIYGQGLNIVVKDQSNQRAAMEKLLAAKNVKFKVCAATMNREKIDKSRLLDGVEVVPDGIYEIIIRQQEGWGYIKVAH